MLRSAQPRVRWDPNPRAPPGRSGQDPHAARSRQALLRAVGLAGGQAGAQAVAARVEALGRGGTLGEVLVVLTAQAEIPAPSGRRVGGASPL